jgi:hypothetical protein
LPRIYFFRIKNECSVILNRIRKNFEINSALCFQALNAIQRNP